MFLQDRQAGPGHVSAFSVGAPATALMVKEDHSLLGVGTTGEGSSAVVAAKCSSIRCACRVLCWHPV